MNKKTMLAISALCATVAIQAKAVDPLVSSDVVGYSSNNLRYGSIGLVPQFVGVGTQNGVIDLQDIKCGDGCSDSVVLSQLNSIGIAGDPVFWVDWYTNPDTGDTEACWVDGSTYEKVEDFTVAPGQGLWVQGDSTDQLFQSAGMVSKADVAVQLQYGSTMTGNPTPVQIDLQDIRCGDGCSDSVVLSQLNNIGIAGDPVFWVDWYTNPDTGDTEACWVDGSTYEKVEGFTVNPGEGLWIQADSSDQYVYFPGVEL